MHMGITKREYQDSRDAITRSIVRDLSHYRAQLEEVEKAVANLLPVFECTLITMPGIEITDIYVGDIIEFSVSRLDIINRI